MAKLVIIGGPDTGLEIPLNGSALAIGRSHENDYELRDSLASRRHTRLVRRGAAWAAEDLKSSNGTFVNDERIESRDLKDGDRLRIGESTFVFLTNDRAPAPLPIPPAMSRRIARPIAELPKAFTMDLRTSLSGAPRAAGDSLVLSGAGEADPQFFVLYQLAKALTSAPALDAVLDTALRLIFDVLPGERGAILILDRASGELVPRWAFHRARGRVKPDEVTVSRTIARQALTERVSLLTADAQEDPRLQAGASIHLQHIRSALCVPLWDQDEVLGVIYLDHLAKACAFTDEHCDLLSAIANLVAIRIRQSELQDRLRTEQVIRATYERYFPPDIVEMMVREPGKSFPLEEREVTVLFCDVQDSTGLAERMRPAEFADLLNGFLEAATEAIFAHRGHVNKYIGDAVFAVFGAPQPLADDHAMVAIQAARRILRAVHDRNALQPADRRINVRVGINSGTVVAGNVGPEKRREYAVLGDPVNVAERLIHLPDINRIVVGPATHERVKDRIATRSLGPVPMKGKAAAVTAYEVLIA